LIYIFEFNNIQQVLWTILDYMNGSILYKYYKDSFTINIDKEKEDFYKKLEQNILEWDKWYFWDKYWFPYWIPQIDRVKSFSNTLPTYFYETYLISNDEYNTLYLSLFKSWEYNENIKIDKFSCDSWRKEVINKFCNIFGKWDMINKDCYFSIEEKYSMLLSFDSSWCRKYWYYPFDINDYNQFKIQGNLDVVISSLWEYIFRPQYIPIEEDYSEAE